MAIIIKGSPPWTSAQRGVQLPEDGISVKRFAVRYYLEINEKLPSNTGETIARAFSQDPSREITIEAETTSEPGTGVLAFDFATVILSGTQAGRIHNNIVWGGVNATVPGSIFMDEVTETQERAGWRSINMRLSTYPQLVTT